MSPAWDTDSGAFDLVAPQLQGWGLHSCGLRPFITASTSNLREGQKKRRMAFPLSVPNPEFDTITGTHVLVVRIQTCGYT